MLQAGYYVADIEVEIFRGLCICFERGGACGVLFDYDREGCGHVFGLCPPVFTGKLFRKIYAGSGIGIITGSKKLPAPSLSYVYGSKK